MTCKREALLCPVMPRSSSMIKIVELHVNYTYSLHCAHFGFWKKNALRKHIASGTVLMVRLMQIPPLSCT